MFRVLLVSSCLFVGSHAFGASFHPFHLSTSEIERNAKTGKLEVSLKIHGSDLERALGEPAGKRVSIGEDGAANALIEKYLDSHFYFETDVRARKRKGSENSSSPEQPNSEPAQDELAATKSTKNDKAPKKSTAKVLGTEFRNNWLWVYFEVTLPKDKPEKSWQLTNALLVDLVDNQINTTQIRSKNSRKAMRTTARTPAVSIPKELLSLKNAISVDQ